MMLVYDVTYMLVPAQIFPGGMYLKFNFPGYPDLRIHKRSFSGYLAYVTRPHKWHIMVTREKETSCEGKNCDGVFEVTNASVRLCWKGGQM